MRRLVRLGQRRHRRRQLQLREAAGRGRAHDKIVGLQPLEQDLVDARRLCGHQRRQHAGDHAQVAVAEQAHQPRDPLPVGQRRQRRRLRRADRPVAIRIETRQRRRGTCRGRAAPARASRRRGSPATCPTADRACRSTLSARASAPSAVIASILQRLIRLAIRHDLGQHRHRRAVANGAERADGLDDDRRIGAALLHDLSQRRDRGRRLRSRPARARQTPPCTGRACRATSAAPARPSRSPSRCSAYATGHHVDTGWPLASSTAAASASYDAEPDERVQPEPHGLCRRPPAGYVRSSGAMPMSAPALTCACTIALTSGASARSPIRPSASAARPWTMGLGVLQRRGQRRRARRRRRSSPSANAAICRTSTSSSASSFESGSTPSAQSDAADGERRAAPDARLGIGRAARMRSDGGGGATICGRVLVAGTRTTGGGGFGSRRMRWSSSRMIHVSFSSHVMTGGVTVAAARRQPSGRSHSAQGTGPKAQAQRPSPIQTDRHDVGP